MGTIPRTPEEHRAYWREKHPLVPYGTCACGCKRATPLSAVHYPPKGQFKGFPTSYYAGPHARSKPFENFAVTDLGHDTPCWVWQGATKGKSRYGHEYGFVRDKNRGGASVLVHRFFYEYLRGPIPEGKHIDHLCRVTLCVNPDHLEPVTQTENTRRGKSAKLTPGMVEDIRYLAATGRYGYKWLGRAYGVEAKAIDRVVNGRRWREDG